MEDALQSAIGYHFKDKKLLNTALTHPSMTSVRGENYQRLEFLGDAVLELTMSRILYFKLSDVGEGQLTRLRAELVREESLYHIAQRLGVAKAIRLSPGEEKTGGREKPSILSDVVEAIIGGVYLDGGFDEALGLVERMFEGTIDIDKLEEHALDAKSRLQELMQKNHGMPVYTLIDVNGPDHMPTFVYSVSRQIGEEQVEIGRGQGHTKQSAQQMAARDALNNLRQD